LSSTGAVPVLLGAGAGAMAALALRDAVLASPVALEWVRSSLEPLLRAGTEGYMPSSPERRRLALIGTVVAVAAGWMLGGTTVALPLTVAGPAIAAWAVAHRRGRYRSAVERALAEVSVAIADSLSAGRSLRSSLAAAASTLEGPAAVELARLGAELGLGVPTADAVDAWRRRLRSARVDAFAAALLSQRLAGGDLAGLLRRYAAGAAERDRVAEDARSATAQARFTGLLVVAMPTGGALFAELLQPGFLLGILGSPAAAVLLALAVALQAVGFLTINHLSKVSP
jgi:tight adherence protein B